MSVNIKNFSRLQFGTLLNIDGFEFWDLLQLPDIPPQPDDTFYTVLGTDRIDTLANKFYGNPILWWVLALANDLELLPTDLNVGSVLRVPSQRYVQKVLFKKAVTSGGVLP
jgi:nucleoid-associated protein YgaU